MRIKLWIIVFHLKTFRDSNLPDGKGSFLLTLKINNFSLSHVLNILFHVESEPIMSCGKIVDHHYCNKNVDIKYSAHVAFPK